MDDLFKIETLSATPNPFDLVYIALHQCYTADPVSKPDEYLDTASIAIDRLLNGGRGHWGCFEHPTITLGCYNFPHSVIVQLRTHRVGVSFDVQSGRYTGENVIKLARAELKCHQVFYTRPAGIYTDRNGKRFKWSETDVCLYEQQAVSAAVDYARLVERGVSEELARAALPYEQRQHFIFTANARSLCHILDLRSKKNAQIEIQWFSELLFKELEKWMPELADYYLNSRYGKGSLAP
jgi:thymidylate synthase (FAD)